MQWLRTAMCTALESKFVCSWGIGATWIDCLSFGSRFSHCDQRRMEEMRGKFSQDRANFWMLLPLSPLSPLCCSWHTDSWIGLILGMLHCAQAASGVRQVLQVSDRNWRVLSKAESFGFWYSKGWERRFCRTIHFSEREKIPQYCGQETSKIGADERREKVSQSHSWPVQMSVMGILLNALSRAKVHTLSSLEILIGALTRRPQIANDTSQTIRLLDSAIQKGSCRGAIKVRYL